MNTEIENLRGNVIIRDFMEEPQIPIRCKYHCSFDWINPACLKWHSINITDEEYFELSMELDSKAILYEITPLFNQLVENIKWYNKNKLNK